MAQHALMSTRHNIAAHIKAQMAAKPSLDTQSKLSKESGLAQATVSRLIHATGDPTVATVEQVAQTLGVSSLILFAQQREAAMLEAWFKLNDDERHTLMAFMQVAIKSKS